MANETVTYDLATVLNDIKTDIKSMQATQTSILLNQTKLEGKIDALETKLEGKIDALENKLEGKISKIEIEVNVIKEDIKAVKGTQGQQIWALIGVFELVLSTVLETWLKVC